PMQIGIGGAAGDEYDALRHFLADPSLGPHDPTTAVELAAQVLIKDKGAPTGQPIDAYRDYARAYNGAGPTAEAYAARVLADAHTYQGAGTLRVRFLLARARGRYPPAWREPNGIPRQEPPPASASSAQPSSPDGGIALGRRGGLAHDGRIGHRPAGAPPPVGIVRRPLTRPSALTRCRGIR